MRLGVRARTLRDARSGMGDDAAALGPRSEEVAGIQRQETVDARLARRAGGEGVVEDAAREALLVVVYGSISQGRSQGSSGR